MPQCNFNFPVVIVKKKVKRKNGIHFNKPCLTHIAQILLFAACNKIVKVAFLHGCNKSLTLNICYT